MAYNRRRTRSQNDRSGILRKQSAWLGENRDQDPTTLAEGEVALLENAIAHEKHVEERPGSWLHSNSNELVGDCYGKFFHKASKRWIFHIEGHLYWSDFDGVTLTEIFDYANVALGENLSANGHTIMKEFLDGVLITIKNSFRSGLVFVRISETVPRFYNMTAPCPTLQWAAFTNDVATRLHRYRILYTFSRIEDGSANTSDRQNGGRVIHESGTVTGIGNNSIDYKEIALEDAIEDEFPSISMLQVGTAKTPSQYASDSSPHWNFISIYRTLDIGSDYGVDSKTGEVNDPNLYIWVADKPLPIIPATFATNISDEILRARISSSDGASAFILKSRGFFPIGADANYSATPNASDVSNFAVSPNFVFAIMESRKTQVDYCQLDATKHAGYHSPLQNKKFAQNVNAIQVYQNLAVFCHTSSMSGGDLNAYQDRGFSGSPMFMLESFYPLDQVNGITDYATIAETENGRFIAVCSDKTVRVFGGVRFGDDLCRDTISSAIMKKAVTLGAVAKFFNGAYLLWFSDEVDGDSNERCIRLAVHKSAGRGWSEYWDFLKANRFHVGEVVIDDNGFHRLMAQDFDDGFLYEIETYNGPEGSEILRAVRDKMVHDLPSSGEAIVSRVKLPDYTGELESFLCRHQATNAYIRARLPYSNSNYYAQETSGFAFQFSLDLNGYADGDLADTITGAPVSGDLEFHNPVAGNRIGVEFIMNAGGWRLVRCDTHFRVIDQKKAEGINDTNEAGYLTELEESRLLWISRGKNLDLERCLGRRYSLLDPQDGGFVSATGPDGVDGSAIAFTTDAGSQLRGASAAGVPWLSETVLDDDFSISFWYKVGAGGFVPGEVLSGLDAEALEISMTDATTMRLENFAEDITIADVDDDEWHHFLIRRASGTVVVLQNGTSRGSFVDAVTSPTINGSTTYVGHPSIQLFDFFVCDSALSTAAMAFYREDVLSNSGKKALPYF